MASASPVSTTAKLTFFIQPPDGVRAFQSINQVNAAGGVADRVRNFEREEKEVVIQNLRGKEDFASLDKTGFQIVYHPAKHTTFTDDDEIKREYYPESAELIKKVTGASRVVFFDHSEYCGAVMVGPRIRYPQPFAAIVLERSTTHQISVSQSHRLMLIRRRRLPLHEYAVISPPGMRKTFFAVASKLSTSGGP